MTVFRRFVDLNIASANALERLLPGGVVTDGNKCFLSDVLPRVFRPKSLIYDVGGGARPYVSLEKKARHDLTIVGLDISAEELAAAPSGAYDRVIVADLCNFRGAGDADQVICQAVLEHVPDGPGAIRALASIVKPGGRIYLFAPSRNAVFARLNLVLPEGLKRRLLFALFPHKAQGHDGFKAWYDKCTPLGIERSAHANGLEVEERRLFWNSSYFKIFVPAYLIWRIWQAIAYLALGEEAAEAFYFVLRKPV